MKRTVIALVLVAVLGLLALLLFKTMSGVGKPPPAEFFAWGRLGQQRPKLFEAPSFAEVDQHGAKINNAALHGHPWIVDFIYTQCTSACPMMTSRMVLLQRALGGLDIRFVSFSVDPDHDTPEVLAQYAHRWNSSETRWLLLATPKDRLQATVDGFRVTAEETADPGNPIIHSSVFLLVDADGWVRGVYDSNDPSARARLVADVRVLGTFVAPSGATADSDLFASLGCGGCHNDPRVAPRLDDLLGTEVQLQDGEHVVADDAYLRRSLVDPGAQVVAGYSPLMPSYADELSSEQLDELVREVKAMKSATPTAPQSPATLVIDPVCDMKVRAAPETVHATYQGHDVYFCSESCRDEFLAHPEKFGPSAPGHDGRPQP